MKKRVVSILLVAAMAAGTLAGCGKSSDSGSSDAAGGDEGKVINIYSWNDEFRERVEAVYPEVKETSKDGTVTTLNDGTEIHWIINPNQDGVYQQKLDEALMNQADAAADDKIDIFLSETDYVNKYTDADADAAIPLKDLGLIRIQIWRISMNLQKLQLLMSRAYRGALHGSVVRDCWYIGVILPRRYSGQTLRRKSDKK